MTSTITGLGSGFDIDSWVSSLVSVKKSSLVTPLETKKTTLQSTNSALSGLKSKYSALQSALQTFTKTIYDSASDMWTNTSINSSDSNYVSATSSGTISAASVNVKVDKIATATVAKSYEALGSGEGLADTKFTKLANNQAKAGTFSMFLNGKKYEITINEEDQLGQVLEKLNNITKADEESESLIDATLEDGILTIKPKDEGASFVLGSAGDTSNIMAALKLYEPDGNGYKSAYAISKMNTAAAMASEASGLGSITFSGEGETGTIKINGAEIKVNKDMSLNDLISKINNNSDTKVQASYDSLTNRLILTSSETGKSNIALEEENTNLLNVLSLTEGTGSEEKLIEGSQTLGENAVVYVNDNKIISNSNTITGESSGITNLTINVKKPTTGVDDIPDSIKLDIEPDYTQIKEGLNTFVSAYNEVVSSTKSAVATGGSMAHDSSLNSILSSMRAITMSTSSNDGEFSILSQIGISTSKTDPTKLSIDSAKLEDVLKNNFESVKYLISDGYTDSEDTGLFDKLFKNVNSVLDSTSGYFATKTESINSQISTLDSRIERANTQLSKYETRITAQFNRMDSVMSQLSSQLSTFQAYIGS